MTALATVAFRKAEYHMTDEEFSDLTGLYISATEARLALIKADLPMTPEVLATYREVANREWELGLAWDAELLRTLED
ncbi:MAG: hypothetical protein JWM76_375 [Pseudonocardiales bacterium]|nr:hypothetical protein [Pseudonocardiales bacterium]